METISFRKAQFLNSFFSFWTNVHVINLAFCLIQVFSYWCCHLFLLSQEKSSPQVVLQNIISKWVKKTLDTCQVLVMSALFTNKEVQPDRNQKTPDSDISTTDSSSGRWDKNHTALFPRSFWGSSYMIPRSMNRVPSICNLKKQPQYYHNLNLTHTSNY